MNGTDAEAEGVKRRGVLALAASVPFAGCTGLGNGLNGPNPKNTKSELKGDSLFTRVETAGAKSDPETICVEDEKGDLVDMEGTIYASRIWLEENATTKHDVRTVRIIAKSGKTIHTLELEPGEYSTGFVCLPPGTNRLVAVDSNGDVVSTATVEVTVQ